MANVLNEEKKQQVLALGRLGWSRRRIQQAKSEVGYVPLAEIGAEFLFQVIAERAERASLIVTTNLPFSEWTQVFPNPRLCKALLDRITDRAHIIETGTDLLSLPANPGGAQQEEGGAKRRQRMLPSRVSTSTEDGP